MALFLSGHSLILILIDACVRRLAPVATIFDLVVRLQLSRLNLVVASVLVLASWVVGVLVINTFSEEFVFLIESTFDFVL